MIRIPLPDSYEPIELMFSEDPHDTRIKIMIGEVDVTDMLICARDVLQDAREATMKYHAGVGQPKNPDLEYEADRDLRDSAGAS